MAIVRYTSALGDLEFVRSELIAHAMLRTVNRTIAGFDKPVIRTLIMYTASGGDSDGDANVVWHFTDADLALATFDALFSPAKAPKEKIVKVLERISVLECVWPDPESGESLQTPLGFYTERAFALEALDEIEQLRREGDDNLVMEFSGEFTKLATAQVSIREYPVNYSYFFTEPVECTELCADDEPAQPGTNTGTTPGSDRT